MPMSLVLYLAYSANNRILDQAYQHTPLIEPLVDGGAFLGISPTGLVGLVRDLAGCFEDTPSAGVANNPLVARAAMMAGQDGRRRGLRVERCAGSLLYRVPSGRERLFMAELPVAMLWPLPDKVRRKLPAMGFFTIGDVAQASEQELVARCGSWGPLIAAYARGEDGRRVAALYPPLRIAWRRDVPGCASRDVLSKVLEDGARNLAQRMRERGMGCRKLMLALALREGAPLEGEWETAGLTPEPDLIYTQLLLLLSRLKPRMEVAEVRVDAAALYPLAAQQVDLFSMRRVAGQTDLDRAVAVVERKYPGCLLRGCASLLSGLRRERALSFYDPWRAGQTSLG